MNKAVLASALWAATAGFAAAKITLSADARVGFVSVDGSSDTTLISRGRAILRLSGTTDTGLRYGGFISSSEINETFTGSPFSLYVEAGFGRLSVGNVDGAATAAIGHVRGVGLVSANDRNEVTYIANGGNGFRTALFGNTSDPSALLRLDAQDLTFYASVTQPERAGQNAYSVAAKHVSGNFTYAIAYEHETTPTTRIKHIIAGVTATFGDLTAKAIYGTIDPGTGTYGTDQWGVSATYAVEDLTMIAYYTDDEDLGTAASNAVAYGLGANYRLADGVTFMGGLYHNQTRNQTGIDLGLFLSF